MNEDHRVLLGVGREASADEIRAAYRRAAKRAHPDMGGSREAFQRIRTAADVLLAALEAGVAAPAGFARFDGERDRMSQRGHWTSVSAELREVWGLMREPVTVIAPQKIGLSPFVNDLSLNLPAYQWLNRIVGPRGANWDFHSAGSVTRMFFRRESDVRLFQLRFF